MGRASVKLDLDGLNFGSTTSSESDYGAWIRSKHHPETQSLLSYDTVDVLVESALPVQLFTFLIIGNYRIGAIASVARDADTHRIPTRHFNRISRQLWVILRITTGKCTPPKAIQRELEDMIKRRQSVVDWYCQNRPNEAEKNSAHQHFISTMLEVWKIYDSESSDADDDASDAGECGAKCLVDEDEEEHDSAPDRYDSEEF
ncbi:hypothetical protein B0H10DRAFT_1958624 [Mycena sp. CBHHK59/15]|nr:hypothetical protein B0H10DRAFT_1958624 [Mycena sp. CBHHK59/15]